MRIIKISLKSLLKNNSGGKLLLGAMIMIFLIPTFLYSTASSVVYAVQRQREAVYGIFDDIYYRNKVQSFGRVSDSEIRLLLPDYQYDGFGAFYTVKTLDSGGTKRINLGYADGEALRLGNVSLAEGRFPENDGEIAITAGISEELGAPEIGENITLAGYDFILCGIVNDFGRLWLRGELQIKNSISPVNAFVTENDAKQIFDERFGVIQQIVLKSSPGIFNINNDSQRLFHNSQGAGKPAYEVPQSFMAIMYAMSVLVVITVLSLDRPRLLKRLESYYLLGMDKRDIGRLAVFEKLLLTVLGMLIGLILSAACAGVCVYILTADEYGVALRFNAGNNILLICSLLAGFAIIFSVYSRLAVKKTDMSGERYVKVCRFPEDKRITLFGFDMRKTAKPFAAMTLLIALSCTLLCYGVAYKNYFTEDITDVAEGYIPIDYDFQFTTDVINTGALTDPETGDYIVPAFFTNNYEKNGAGKETVDKISEIDGVSKVTAYRENQKMNLLLNVNQIDGFFDCSDSAADGGYDMRQFMTISDFGAVWEEFDYQPDDVLVCSEVVGYTEEALEKLSDKVAEGEINIEKLLSGEEIILRAPAFKLKEVYFGDIRSTGIIPCDYRDEGAVNLSSLKVGDEITLSGILTDKNINGGVAKSGMPDFYRKDVTVKIGAIIRSADGKLQSSRPGAACSVLTANEAFETLGIPANYSVISVYTDSPEDGESVFASLAEINAELPHMSLENWASDVKSYKIYNMLAAIFAATLTAVLTAVTLAVLTGQFYAKTRLSLRTYELFIINGLSFSAMIKQWLAQIFLMYSAGAALSVPVTNALICGSMRMLRLANFLSGRERITIIAAVFVMTAGAVTPSLGVMVGRDK